MNLIEVTRVFDMLTDKAKDKFNKLKDDYTASGGVEPRDEYGRTAEDYEDLGMDIPQELVDNQPVDSPFAVMQNFKSGDFMRVETPILLNTLEVEYIEKNIEGGSLLYLKSKRQVFIKEELDYFLKLKG